MQHELDMSVHTASDGAANIVSRDLAYIRTAIVNVFFAGPRNAGDRGWVLIDTGMPGSANRIRQVAAQRFGPHARPASIILTHGHFDHVGAVRALAAEWDAPVYAHPLELPYLTGRSSYPPPDPTVGGGAMATLSFTYPRKPIDLDGRVHPLPTDGSVPGLPDWRWLHTPGHSPGHVALFRDADRVLVAGDAIVTTKQESALAVLQQTPILEGPPAYFTPDWQSAHQSVIALAELEPEVIATGHGKPLAGVTVRQSLHNLARTFEQRAVPKHGRYVGRPALTDLHGVVAVPPPVGPSRTQWLAGGAAAALAAALLLRRRR